jgi:membrane associated rhomboid family serine protease
MIPLRDNIPSFRRPYINYLLITATVLIFLVEMASGPYLQKIVDNFGFVPRRFIGELWDGFQPLPEVFLPLLTSIFLHGGWLHLIGNMWFLYIFGDNVEDALGHGRYLLLYTASGMGANFIYLLFSPFSPLPLVGASGAIAGIMGAYFFLFPGARILTLVPIFFFPTFWELPAYIFLGFWFFLQFLFGTFSSIGPPTATGGVAWWAHVGGFLVGVLLLHLLAPQRVRLKFRRA